MDVKDAEKRLSAIKSKVSGMEAEHRAEMKAIERQVQELGRERDSLRQISGENSKKVESLMLEIQEADARKKTDIIVLQKKLTESSEACEVLESEINRHKDSQQGKAQALLKHDHEMNSMQQRYEDRIDELENKLATRDRELDKSRSKEKEMQSTLKSKEKEISRIEVVVSNQIIERGKIMDKIKQLEKNISL